METLKPEELTREMLCEMARFDILDDCYNQASGIFQTIVEEGEYHYKLEDNRTYYAELDEEDRKEYCELFEKAGLKKEVRSDENPTSR